MRKTISLTSHQRPEYLRRVLESLSTCEDIQDWNLIISQNPTVKAAECVEVIEAFEKKTGCNVVLLMNQKIFSVRDNPFRVLRYAFETLESDVNIYLEDDVIVSRWTTRLALWYHQNAPDPTKPGGDVCLCLFNNKPDYGMGPALLRRPSFEAALGLVILPSQWKIHLKPNW